MLKKTFQYTDFNGNEQEETFYFNLSKSEVIEYELQERAGMSTTLQRIVEERDNQKILAHFMDLVMKSVGRKSDDGRRFVKNDEIREDFLASPAYDEMFIWLMSEPGAGAEFVNNVLPQDVDEFVKKVDSGQQAAKNVKKPSDRKQKQVKTCLLYTSPSPRD